MDSHTKSTARPPSSQDGLPGYSQVDPAAAGQDSRGVDITAMLANLSVQPNTLPTEPDPESCLVHLKFLHALQSLKEDVGYTDGLWNIWDTRADHESPEWADVLPKLTERSKTAQSPDAAKKMRLSKLREKRWVIFVARAVDRYEAWWKSLSNGQHDYLTEAQMALRDYYKYDKFAKRAPPSLSDQTSLPPLGASHQDSPDSAIFAIQS